MLEEGFLEGLSSELARLSSLKIDSRRLERYEIRRGGRFSKASAAFKFPCFS